MEQRQYVCQKCGCREYVSDQFQATGGNFAKIFDIQNKRFITISCRQCGFTELYSSQTDGGMNCWTSCSADLRLPIAEPRNNSQIFLYDTTACPVCVPKPTEYATASGAAGVERLQWNHEEQRRMPHIG